MSGTYPRGHPLIRAGDNGQKRLPSLTFWCYKLRSYYYKYIRKLTAIKKEKFYLAISTQSSWICPQEITATLYIYVKNNNQPALLTSSSRCTLVYIYTFITSKKMLIFLPVCCKISRKTFRVRSRSRHKIERLNFADCYSL